MKKNKYICFLSFICIGLLLASCGGEGTSEPIQYPREISVETYSSMAESSSLEIPESSEMQSSSSASFLCVIGTGEDCEYGTLIDERDGHTYKTMKIGGQEWMAENLNYQIGIKNCYHDSCAVYGQRYSWKTAMDSVGAFSTNGIGCGFGQMCSPDYPVRGICPAGWHLPSNFEIEPMTLELGRLREFAAQGEDSSTKVQFVKQFLTHLEFWSSTEENWHSAPFLSCGEESCSLFPATCLKKNNINVRCVKGQNAEQNMDKLLFSNSQSSSSSEIKSSSSSKLFISYGEMTDERDGKTYKTMTIGGRYFDEFIPKQTWMVENLNYAYLQPTSTLDSSSWCYDNAPENCEKYGRLYIWSAAIDSSGLHDHGSKAIQYIQGICPDGWHLPTYDEDMALIPWRYCCDGMDDSFNYNKSRAGVYYTEENRFWGIGNFFTFWLSKENDELAQADVLNPSSLAYSEGYSFSDAVRYESKHDAISVRCVKDIPDIE